MKTNLIKVIIVACVSVVVVNFLFHPAPRRGEAGTSVIASGLNAQPDFSAFAVAYAMPPAAGVAQPQRPFNVVDLSREWEPIILIATDGFSETISIGEAFEASRVASAAPSLGAPLSPAGGLIDFNFQPAMDFSR